MATAEETAPVESQDQIGALIDSTREQFEAQMEELRPAHEAFLRLEGIVANFDKVITGTPRKTRTRAGGLSRPDEFTRLITESGTDGITVTEAAEKMGMNQNYLYRIGKDLIAAGTVVKGEDKRYRAA